MVLSMSPFVQLHMLTLVRTTVLCVGCSVSDWNGWLSGVAD